MEKLMIVDGHNLLFRMFYGIPGSIKNSYGKEIKGIVGFIGGVNKLIKKISPDKLVIVFDSETSIKERLNEYDDYKQNRIDYSVMPENENPFSQLESIYKVLTYLNIYHLEACNHEADDYIASICASLKNQYAITIVSTDRDFLQLVDNNVTVYNPRGSEGIYFTPEEVFNRYMIGPHQVIDYKVLVGDKSDNITGVKSIGPKTAVKILNHGTLDELLSSKKDLDEKLYKKLYDNAHIITRNKKLISMKKDIDICLDHMQISYHIDMNKRTMDLLRECDMA